MNISVKRSLWRIGLLLLPVLFVGFFSSCSEDEDEPGTGSSSKGLIGTWMDRSGDFGYRFSENGAFIGYDYGGTPSGGGTYRVLSDDGEDILILNWDDGETDYIPYSLRDDILMLFSETDSGLLYRQSDDDASDEDEYPFIGTWIEDADFATSENVQFVFEANGDFSYTYYEYSRKVYSGNGEWWVEYDEYSGDLELHVSDYTYGDSYYFSIRNSSSSRLTLREEHSDEVFSLTRRY